MTHPFKIGQLIRLLPGVNNRAVAALAGIDPDAPQAVSNTLFVNGLYFVQLLDSKKNPQFQFKAARFESQDEWAKRQAPAAPNIVHALDAAIQNKAEGAFNPPTYASQRQAAWDEYVASRAKANLNAVVNSPRHAGFLAGFEAGRQTATVTGAAVPLAALLRPLSRVGEAVPAITKAKALKIADAILVDLQQNGPATAEAIANRIDRPLNSVSPRFAQLVRADRIHVAAGVGNRSVYKFGKRD